MHVGLECLKGLAMFFYKIISAKKAMRKKSIMDIRISHVVILGFVNAFGYLLPTLFMLRRGFISVFEYLFQSFYLDLFFTVTLSFFLLKRTELLSLKILLPLAISVFGMAFHYTVYLDKESDDTLKILKFTFVDTLPKGSTILTPGVESKYFYVFLISRLSKCFVCVASKLFLLKEQAYRKSLMVIKAQELKKKLAAE